MISSLFSFGVFFFMSLFSVPPFCHWNKNWLWNHETLSLTHIHRRRSQTNTAALHWSVPCTGVLNEGEPWFELLSYWLHCANETSCGELWLWKQGLAYFILGLDIYTLLDQFLNFLCVVPLCSIMEFLFWPQHCQRWETNVSVVQCRRKTTLNLCPYNTRWSVKKNCTSSF